MALPVLLLAVAAAIEAHAVRTTANNEPLLPTSQPLGPDQEGIRQPGSQKGDDDAVVGQPIAVHRRNSTTKAQGEGLAPPSEGHATRSREKASLRSSDASRLIADSDTGHPHSRRREGASDGGSDLDGALEGHTGRRQSSLSSIIDETVAGVPKIPGVFDALWHGHTLTAKQRRIVFLVLLDLIAMGLFLAFVPCVLAMSKRRPPTPRAAIHSLTPVDE
ncbi:unnamed protein product [Vitrella brassicaformis CCMP3155]|uniref:Uncharacterized protein n=1 Tax=Vitrella brassicaformis (strain CCMP3155) TaxID=1169540 RepID=A0A0G4EQJ5_VITBC|nr:unnamed protein product [Vitrella brassicaformis CCMP3155]|eukprot:CEL99503.1 unnamed protein product [Vitrella brassicaformis CCMP3155]